MKVDAGLNASCYTFQQLAKHTLSRENTRLQIRQDSPNDIQGQSEVKFTVHPTREFH